MMRGTDRIISPTRRQQDAREKDQMVGLHMTRRHTDRQTDRNPKPVSFLQRHDGDLE